MANSSTQTAPTVLTNLLAGGGAGIMEALVCQPLDTIKTKMQMEKKSSVPGTQTTKPGIVSTTKRIVARQGPLALYRGLTPVVIGMAPKMALRFTSFETYKGLLADSEGKNTSQHVFLAGLAAGVTEAILVVNPMEVVKIRMQTYKPAVQHSTLVPSGQMASRRNYSTMQISGERINYSRPSLLNVVKETLAKEGVSTLYRGMTLTALRQGTNQAANFSVYTSLKRWLENRQPEREGLPGYQTALVGLLSGAAGPLSNAPIDTIKTRLQSSSKKPGQTAFRRVVSIATKMLQTEGTKALYNGVTPRIMRVAPGQAVTFTAYEFLKKQIEPNR